MAKWLYNEDITDEIQNLWRIHQNREAEGLPGTYQPTGVYSDKMDRVGYESSFISNFSTKSYFTGDKNELTLINPFTRSKKEMHDYAYFFEDLDRGMEFEFDQPERTKIYKAPREAYVDEWFEFPATDDDSEFEMNDHMGDWAFSDPPPMNYGPPADMKMDEEDIWNFNDTVLNAQQVENEWSTNFRSALKRTYIPDRQKLITEHYYSDESLAITKFHWNLRLGLEQLKLKHVEIAKHVKITNKVH